jgi:thioredoxin-related protein
MGNFQLSTFHSPQKNLLLLFYSPSCFHCTELIIDLIPYAEKVKLPVIALQIDDDMNPWSFPENWIQLKVNKKIRQDYGVFSTPSLFLLQTKNKRISAIPENLTELKEIEHLF